MKSNRLEPSTRLQKNRGKIYDFYRTPSYVTEQLLIREKFKGIILEPCCGDGAISKILENNNYYVVSSDIEANKHNYGKQKDFLEYKSVSNIITNPPFTYATDFILHGLKIVKRKLAILARIALLETPKRYELIFKDYQPKCIYIFSRRINFNGIDTFGGTLLICWYVWDKDYTGKTYIDWIL